MRRSATPPKDTLGGSEERLVTSSSSVSVVPIVPATGEPLTAVTLGRVASPTSAGRQPRVADKPEAYASPSGHHRQLEKLQDEGDVGRRPL